MTKPFALIIEDDPMLGHIFTLALNQIGFEAKLDEVGTKYRSMMEDRTPSVVFLDVHLPYASGADILDEIRANERWENIIVVLMTADIAMSKTLEKKANISLLKPVRVMRIQEIGSKILAELPQG